MSRTLYHQTSSDAARVIKSSGKMYRGSSGLAGGGIYFAETPRDTEHKAQHHGEVLSCEVDLGRTLELGPDGDSSMTHTKLKSMGYDSVKITGRRGDEYVVYNHAQVKPPPTPRPNRSEAPTWRKHCNGLNYEGTCTNQHCEAHGQRVIIQRGYGSFDVAEDPLDNRECPMCNQECEEVPEVLYLNRCVWAWAGRKAGKDAKKVEGNMTIGDAPHRSKKGSECSWRTLKFEVKRP